MRKRTQDFAPSTSGHPPPLWVLKRTQSFLLPPTNDAAAPWVRKRTQNSVLSPTDDLAWPYVRNRTQNPDPSTTNNPEWSWVRDRNQELDPSPSHHSATLWVRKRTQELVLSTSGRSTRVLALANTIPIAMNDFCRPPPSFLPSTDPNSLAKRKPAPRVITTGTTNAPARKPAPAKKGKKHDFKADWNALFPGTADEQRQLHKKFLTRSFRPISPSHQRSLDAIAKYLLHQLLRPLL